MTKFEKWTLITACLSLVISIGSIYLTLWQYFQTNQEKIEIKITQPDENYPTHVIIYKFDSSSTQILPTYWKCLVSNNGDKSISITQYSLVENIDSNTTAFGSPYVQIGLYETFDKPLLLPINIEANSSKYFYLKIGLETKIDSSYWHFKTKDELIEALLNDCKDIYGHHIGAFFKMIKCMQIESA